MATGIITLTKEKRWADKIAVTLYEKGFYKDDGYYPVRDNVTNEEVARFICVYGNWFVIKFLSVITQIRGKNTQKIELKY